MAGEAVSFPGTLLQPTRDLGTLGGGAGVPTLHRNFWWDLSQVRGDGGGFGGPQCYAQDVPALILLFLSYLLSKSKPITPLLQPTQAYSHL